MDEWRASCNVSELFLVDVDSERLEPSQGEYRGRAEANVSQSDEGDRRSFPLHVAVTVVTLAVIGVWETRSESDMVFLARGSLGMAWEVEALFNDPRYMLESLSAGFWTGERGK